MPRKVRSLIADLKGVGFTQVPGGKGSHRKFQHPRYPGSVVLSGKDGDDGNTTKRNKPATPSAMSPMKAEDQYFKFVRWSEEDELYVGYCPDLFPWGGVCHSKDESKAYRTLIELVREEVEDLTKAGRKLPAPLTRPMREVAIASLFAEATAVAA